MNRILTALAAIFALCACNHNDRQIVSSAFIDSLITNYNPSAAINANDTDIQFWKNRIVPGSPDITNSSRYAAALVARFNLLGNIADVTQADSILYQQIKDYNGKEASSYTALLRHAILQHQFVKADSFLILAKNIGLKKYDEAAYSFDVCFELGNMPLAQASLKSMYAANDFGYQFRQSKWMHYKGDMDSSINAMKAAMASVNNSAVQQLALSNMGDLYMHTGKMKEAAGCFLQCVNKNAADLHSILGLGWIALVKDKSDSLAKKVFSFVATQTQSPEPLFKLIAVAQQRNDTVLELKYANAFTASVSDERYGNMYNKYLIELYTGVLNNPHKAVTIATSELLNRNTPQTNAWYAWALLKKGQKDEAYKIYETKISGKPLEGLELYYMGKLMQAFNKGYNAKQFFKEAIKNKYDLNPAIVRDIEDNL